MIDSPPVEIVEMVQEKRPESMLQEFNTPESTHTRGRPYCPHPKTDEIEAGSVKIFDGWITLSNQSDKKLTAIMTFTLPKGYHLELTDSENHTLLSKFVGINTSYQIIDTDEGILLVGLDD